MDVKIITDSHNFKFRTCGIIVENGKILVMKLKSANYFHFPGGDVELGEDSKTAVCREIKEEVGCDVVVDNLFCINENFYSDTQKKYHAIEFYYLLTIKDKLPSSDWEIIEQDKGKMKNLTFAWVDIKKLAEWDVRPVNVKNLILNSSLHSFHHLINRDK